MPTYLEIAVYVPQVSGVFHYHVPEKLEGALKPGHLVIVPFGKQTVQGVVFREVETPAVPDTRPVLKLVDPQVVLTANQIRLAVHLSKNTLAPLAACVGLMLPPGLAQQADTLYSRMAGPDDVDSTSLTPTQSRLLALLKRHGPLRGRQIDRRLGRVRWRPAAVGLVRRATVETSSVLPPTTIKPKHIRTAQLGVPPEKLKDLLGDLGSTNATRSRRARMLKFLEQEAVPVNVSWVYAESGGNLADLKLLAERELVILQESEIWRDPLEGLEIKTETVPTLTPDQRKVWGAIQAGLTRILEGKKIPPFLLHGVTGSGKTEIYLRAVEAVIQKGRSALILVPEIALTPQTVRRFMSRFPGRVGLMHSQLSQGERYDTWRRARKGDLDILIGPRSALFAPLKSIGLIVVDECHEGSYYQSDSMPFYHAREAAVDYAGIAGAICILGSATPSVESRSQAADKRWTLLGLPKRILSGMPGQSGQTGELPPVRMVDMRQELKAGNRSIFSRALQETLGATLALNQQAILFLNRRGTATYVFCRDCGHSLMCPRCDEVSLTYHRLGGALVCHRCGYQRKMPKTCPQCGSQRIRHYGTGTERVETEIQDIFPGARTLRWDWETTRKKGAHELILQHFSNHHADILIGTQMLAKGLDLPLVTLVGVVLADVGLNLPDFRAGERSFQTLSQVAGRAGRSHLGGEVILQTFNPGHYVLQSVAKHDFDGFYERELGFRRDLSYPPFGKLVRLEYRSTNLERAEREAVRLAGQIKGWIRTERLVQTDLIGPAPCFYSRLDGRYRWQIVLRGPNPASLLQGRKLADWRVEVNPQSLL